MNDHDITDNKQMDKIMIEIFGDHYRGIIVDDEYKRLDSSKMKNNDIFIYHSNMHWSAIFKLDGKIYEYDSYNRDLLGKRFKNYAIHGFEQGSRSESDNGDCGQRTVAALISVFNKNI